MQLRQPLITVNTFCKVYLSNDSIIPLNGISTKSHSSLQMTRPYYGLYKTHWFPCISDLPLQPLLHILFLQHSVIRIRTMMTIKIPTVIVSQSNEDPSSVKTKQQKIHQTKLVYIGKRPKTAKRISD